MDRTPKAKGLARDHLPGKAGLIEAKRRESKGGAPEYEVEFREHRLEDIIARLNRFERKDEKPFEAVAAVSELNQRNYEWFARPPVQSM